jgi:hypothetical protein
MLEIFDIRNLSNNLEPLKVMGIINLQLNGLVVN